MIDWFYIFLYASTKNSIIDQIVMTQMFLPLLLYIPFMGKTLWSNSTHFKMSITIAKAKYFKTNVIFNYYFVHLF